MYIGTVDGRLFCLDRLYRNIIDYCIVTACMSVDFIKLHYELLYAV